MKGSVGGRSRLTRNKAYVAPKCLAMAPSACSIGGTGINLTVSKSMAFLFLLFLNVTVDV